MGHNLEMRNSETSYSETHEFKEKVLWEAMKFIMASLEKGKRPIVVRITKEDIE